MKIIVLGAGSVLLDIIKQINESLSFNLSAIGVDKTNWEAGKELYDFALKNNISFIKHYSEIEQYDFDYVLMLSYPSLISNEYLNKYNFLNIHYAPLPRYRGFHGFIWSIINGEPRTGYTLHKVAGGIDDGPIYYQFLTDVSNSDDVISILNRIETNIKQKLLNVLLEIYNRERLSIKQDETKAIYVCKRKPEDGLINWEWPKVRVFNFIRALTPPYTPGAFTFYKGEKLIIKSSELWESPDYFSVEGQIVARIPDKGVLVKCGDGALLIKEVIYKGKLMNALDLFKSVGAKLKEL